MPETLQDPSTDNARFLKTNEVEVIGPAFTLGSESFPADPERNLLLDRRTTLSAQFEMAGTPEIAATGTNVFALRKHFKDQIDEIDARLEYLRKQEDIGEFQHAKHSLVRAGVGVALDTLKSGILAGDIIEDVFSTGAKHIDRVLEYVSATEMDPYESRMQAWRTAANRSILTNSQQDAERIGRLERWIAENPNSAQEIIGGIVNWVDSKVEPEFSQPIQDFVRGMTKDTALGPFIDRLPRNGLPIPKSTEDFLALHKHLNAEWEAYADQYLPLNDSLRESFMWSKVPGGFGSMMTMLLETVVLKDPGAVISAFSGAAVTEVYDLAKAHGFSHEEAIAKAKWAIPRGVMEYIPLSRHMKAVHGMQSSYWGRLWGGLLSGSKEEGFQEGLDSFYAAVQRKLQIDPSVKWLDVLFETFEGAAVGSIVGGTTRLGFAMMGATEADRFKQAAATMDNPSARTPWKALLKALGFDEEFMDGLRTVLERENVAAMAQEELNLKPPSTLDTTPAEAMTEEVQESRQAVNPIQDIGKASKVDPTTQALASEPSGGPTPPYTLAELEGQFRAASPGRIGAVKAKALGLLVSGAAKYVGLSPDQYVRQRFGGVVAGGDPAADALFSIRAISSGKQIEAPQVTDAFINGRKLTKKEIGQYASQAKAAGLTEKQVEFGVEALKQFNEVLDFGHPIILDDPDATEVIIRLGTLNTPGVEGFRWARIDTLTEAIAKGEKSAKTGALFEGGRARTGIPKEIRGLIPRVFLNVPITMPRLQRPRPSNMNVPVFVTGNPHISNFKRPHPSWDSHIVAVRVKPVHKGNAAVNQAVVDAIKYAKEVDAKVLITTFRAKQPWVLAKFTDIVPTDPGHPDFDKYWKKNPNPKSDDPRRIQDYPPYVPRNKKVAQEFRKNGWDIEKKVFGRGGTWWWPKTRAVDKAVLDKVGRVQMEYCDLLHKGCPACQNCQKLTYPGQDTAPLVGVTDEPFCQHGCPQCFVRMGQSGVKGRKGISIGKNAKQAGFDEPQWGKTYRESIKIVQGVARRSTGNRKALDFVSKFLDGDVNDRADAAMSLFMDGRIGQEELSVMRAEIAADAANATQQSGEDKLFHTFGEEERASVEFDDDGKALIRALKATSVGDMVHELGHVFRRDLSDDDLRIAEQWAGVKDGNWTVKADEKFAHGFVTYLAEGKSPTTALERIFSHLRRWLKSLAQSIAENKPDIVLSSEIQDLFDRLTAGERQVVPHPAKPGQPVTEREFLEGGEDIDYLDLSEILSDEQARYLEERLRAMEGLAKPLTPPLRTQRAQANDPWARPPTRRRIGHQARPHNLKRVSPFNMLMVLRPILEGREPILRIMTDPAISNPWNGTLGWFDRVSRRIGLRQNYKGWGEEAFRDTILHEIGHIFLMLTRMSEADYAVLTKEQKALIELFSFEEDMMYTQDFEKKPSKKTGKYPLKETIVYRELKALSHWYHPFNPKQQPDHAEYRYKPVEVFAVGISALLNHPNQVMKRAPAFVGAFFSRLESDPMKKAAWDKLQAFEALPDVDRSRIITEVFNESHQKAEDIRRGMEALRKEEQKKSYNPIYLFRSYLEGPDVSMRSAMALVRFDGMFPAPDGMKATMWHIFRREFVRAFPHIMEHPDPLQASPIIKAITKTVQIPNSIADLANQIAVAIGRMHDVLEEPLKKASSLPGGVQMFLENYAFHHGVANGRRGYVLNPRGVDMEESRRWLNTAERQLKENGVWDDFRVEMQKIYDLGFEVARNAIARGHFPAEALEDFQENRDTYFPNLPIKYIQRLMPASLRPVVGSASESGSFFTNKIFKMLAVDFASRYNLEKLQMLDELLRYQEAELVYKQKKFKGQKQTVSRPLNQNLVEQTQVLRDGRSETYWVSKETKHVFDFLVEGSRVPRWAPWEWSKVFWHGAFIKYNPSFLVANLIFDYMRTYMNMPVRKPGDFIMNGVMIASKMHAVANEMWRYQRKGEFGPTIKKMQGLGGVGARIYDPVSVKDSVDALNREIARFGQPVEQRMAEEARHKVIKDVAHALSIIPDLVGTQELIGKAAAFEAMRAVRDAPAEIQAAEKRLLELRKRRGRTDEEELRYRTLQKILKDQRSKAQEDELKRLFSIRDLTPEEQHERTELERKTAPYRRYSDEESWLFSNLYASTPFYLRSSHLSGVLGYTHMFAQVAINSWASAFRMATSPKTAVGWWAKMGAAVIVPKVIQLMGQTGLLGDEYEEMYANVSDYLKEHYLVYPLFWVGEGDDRKVFALTIPVEESGRILSGAMTKMVEDDQDVLAHIAHSMGMFTSELPGEHPNIKMMSAWWTYLNGRNPRDSYFNEDIINPQNFKAMQSGEPGSRSRARVDMINWSFRSLGVLGSIYKRDWWKAIGAGRIMRVTNHGKREQEWKSVRLEEAQKAFWRLDNIPSNVRGVAKQYNWLRRKGEGRRSQMEEFEYSFLSAHLNRKYGINWQIRKAKELEEAGHLEASQRILSALRVRGEEITDQLDIMRMRYAIQTEQ